MPNTKSQEKHLRQTKKRTSRNSLVKRNIKEIIKEGQKAIEKGDIKDKAGELTHKLQKSVDKAVKSGTIKVSVANRKKERFAKMVSKAGIKLSDIKLPAKKKTKEEKK